MSAEVKRRLKAQYGCPIWTTKEGDYVPVVLMSDRHLRNGRRRLERRIAENQAEMAAIPEGDRRTPSGYMSALDDFMEIPWRAEYEKLERDLEYREKWLAIAKAEQARRAIKDAPGISKGLVKYPDAPMLSQTGD